MRVLLTGATGFVGSKIVEALLERGDEVVVLSRNVPKAAMKLGNIPDFFMWNPTQEVAPIEAFTGVDVVINLMGENISHGRWDEARKKKMYDSRVIGTRNLVSTMNQTEVTTFISTSAIGVYGDRPGSEEINEETKVESVDYLSKMCLDWEREAAMAKSEIRSCILRVGIVLERSGGAIAKMITPFKLGLGGAMGNGNQVMSWIHREDLVNLYIACVDNQNFEGIVNATAPRPVSNKVFTHTLGRVIKRPTFFPLPATVAEVVFGEMSVILLEGQKVVPAKALARGFSFKHDTIQKALTHIL